MEEKQYLDRLKEYQSYLETQYKSFENVGRQVSIIGSISASSMADTYRLAKRRLEELFPELVEDSEKGKIK